MRWMEGVWGLATSQAAPPGLHLGALLCACKLALQMLALVTKALLPQLCLSPADMSCLPLRLTMAKAAHKRSFAGLC